MGLLKKLFSRYRDDDFLMEEELWDEDYFYSEERADSEDDSDEFYLSEKEKEMGSEDSEWDWNTIVNDRRIIVNMSTNVCPCLYILQI